MSNADNGAILDTGQGVVVTTTPQPQPPPQYQQATATQPTGRHFTEEDIEKARQQEKDKLYPRIEEMGQQLRTIQEERQTELAERQRLQEEADSARKAKEEQEMDLRTLLEKRDQEWQ